MKIYYKHNTTKKIDIQRALQNNHSFPENHYDHERSDDFSSTFKQEFERLKRDIHTDLSLTTDQGSRHQPPNMGYQQNSKASWNTDQSYEQVNYQLQRANRPERNSYRSTDQNYQLQRVNRPERNSYRSTDQNYQPQRANRPERNSYRSTDQNYQPQRGNRPERNSYRSADQNYQPQRANRPEQNSYRKRYENYPPPPRPRVPASIPPYRSTSKQEHQITKIYREFNPITDLNPRHIGRIEGWHVYLNQSIPLVKLEQVMPPGQRVFVKKKNGETNLAYSGDKKTGRKYIYLNGEEAMVEGGDCLIGLDEYAEEQKNKTFRFSKKTSIGLNTLNHLPSAQVQDLRNVKLPRNLEIIKELFPPEFHWGFYRLAVNLGKRGIILHPGMPITIEDLKSEQAAVYFPRERKVETFNIKWSASGVGNVRNSKRTALGSFQVGKIKYSGLGKVASFSGSGSTILNVCIEKRGLEAINSSHRFEKKDKRINKVHNLKESMGNSNSSARGTHDHGISDARMKRSSGGTWGCTGFFQKDMQRIAESYLAAREIGFPAFIEIQYDGEKMYDYCYDT